MKLNKEQRELLIKLECLEQDILTTKYQLDKLFNDIGYLNRLAFAVIKSPTVRRREFNERRSQSK